MSHLNRYAVETRLLLDLISHELHRLELPQGTEVNVFTRFPGLLEDLADRVWSDYILLPGLDRPKSKVVVYLLSLEEGASQLPLQTADHFIAGFRNQLSHKPLIYGDWQGLWYPSFERKLKKTHHLTASWGILEPRALAHLALAATASRFGYFGIGFHTADRALRSPLCQNAARYICSFGLVGGYKK
jgi:hypothetical protein